MLTKTRTQHYPLGVVGLISPWNYPLSLGVGDVLAALSAGNAVVHKPDSQTTLTAILLRRLAIEAGLPEAAWQLVPGRGAEVGDALVPLVDSLSFTGSTRAGKTIATQAAGRLIPTMLELGGKNPMLVLDDAPSSPPAKVPYAPHSLPPGSCACPPSAPMSTRASSRSSSSNSRARWTSRCSAQPSPMPPPSAR